MEIIFLHLIKVKVFVAVLRDKKSISPAIRNLAKLFPIPKDLIHLKRVKINQQLNTSEIIICKENEASIDQIERQLEN